MTTQISICLRADRVLIRAAMQIISVLIGLACAVLLFFGIIPLLGWTLWATLAGCIIGIIFGAFPKRKIGLTINVAVAIVAILRLFLGGGVF
jgi:hypothetical protein